MYRPYGDLTHASVIFMAFSGSKEKIVVLEQTDPYRDVPEVMPFSSTHYELPVMKEWFSTVSQVQRLPPLHFQAMYNVSVAEIAEQAEDG